MHGIGTKKRMYKYLKGTGLLLQDLKTLIFTGNTPNLQSCVTFGTEWMKMLPLTSGTRWMAHREGPSLLRSGQGDEEMERHSRR
jgi:hypothetical protein